MLERLRSWWRWRRLDRQFNRVIAVMDRVEEQPGGPTLEQQIAAERCLNDLRSLLGLPSGEEPDDGR